MQLLQWKTMNIHISSGFQREEIQTKYKLEFLNLSDWFAIN